jgi:chlorobactene glucosyltransferase
MPERIGPEDAQQSFTGMPDALLFALPWLLLPLVVAWRLRGTPLLDTVPLAPSGAVRAPVAPDAVVPLVSVVLPARNEAAHIAACIATLRATTWPRWELVVVNDNSEDATGALAREAAGGDARVTVLDAPPLPDGWFGKQWACHVGRETAHGDLLLFTDADTRHHPELIARLVPVRADRDADLISVAGRQEMRTFWERAVQPVVFALILTRYGGARAIEQARTPADVVANGQCFLITAACYAAIGGHAGVRDTVAEDLMLAQRTVAHGRRVSLALGHAYLSTRMYDGLGALVRGWRKNVYAGGRLAMKGGRLGRWLFPVLLVGFPLAIAAPFLVAPVAWWRSWPDAFAWSVLAGAAQLIAFAAAARFDRAPVWRALLAPVGALAFAAICAQAIARGRRVEWKDRQYTSV